MARYVCSNCFGDLALHDFVSGEAVECACDFCGDVSTEPIAAPLEEVAHHIEQCLRDEYDDAANCLGYISDEGGWQGETWDAWDLLANEVGMDLPRDEDGHLLEAIVGKIDDCSWCKKNPYGLNYEDAGRFSWQRFCDVVKYERRFFFLDHGGQDTEVLSPGDTLNRILDYAEKTELFVELPSATALYRARKQRDGVDLTSIDQIGPPLPELANQSNRMSPPGIVMFYASDEVETALRETNSVSGSYVVGHFETRRDAVMLDLIALPAIPSIFAEVPDSLEYNPRHVLTFLNQVASEISRPIARDDRVHVNYVPTQIVTEYVRSRILDEDVKVDGIRFESAVYPGHASYVLFATQENMIGSSVHQFEPEDAWIALLDVGSHEVTEERLLAWRSNIIFD